MGRLFGTGDEQVVTVPESKIMQSITHKLVLVFSVTVGFKVD